MSPDVKTASDAENSRELHIVSRNLVYMCRRKKIKVPYDKALHVDDAPQGLGREVAFSLSVVLSIQMPGLSDRQGG